MNFSEWVQHGINQGWCSEPVCGMHEWMLFTPEEAQQFQEGEEPCFTIVRLNGDQA